jgi:acetyl-CoA carboxylase biotin carboxylase subunit
VVRDAEKLQPEIQAAWAEAEAAFGDGALYLEQFIENARHVEVQVLGDGETVVHLFDRDCSVQRRQQKLIEEGPVADLAAEVRHEMLDAAVRLAEACKYQGAGTVEFLYDIERGQVCFIEMNTRLQVEHPVTEMITGIDVVKEQLRVAAGETLGYGQDAVTTKGHAIEVRINAENAAMGFMPSPGEITSLTWPGGPGVRVDSGVVTGSAVQPYYDSMVAKLIIHAETRDAAVRRLLRALDEVDVQGIQTTKSFVRRVAADAAFVDGRHHTRFLDGRPDLFVGLDG